METRSAFSPMSSNPGNVTGIPLETTPAFTTFAANLCRDYEFARSGGFGAEEVSREDFIAYRERLEGLGLQVADRHKRLLMEGIYPVDVPDGRLEWVTHKRDDVESLRALAARAGPDLDPPAINLVAENSD